MSSSLVGLIHHMAFVKLQFDASKVIDEWNRRHTNPKSLIRTYKVFPKIRFSVVVLSLKTKNCNKIAALVVCWQHKFQCELWTQFLHDAKTNTSSETGGPCSSENTSNFWSSENRDLSRWFQSVKLHAWSVKPSETHFTEGKTITKCHRRTRAFLYRKGRCRLSRNHLPRNAKSLRNTFAAAPAFVSNNKFDVTIHKHYLDFGTVHGFW